MSRNADLENADLANRDLENTDVSQTDITKQRNTETIFSNFFFLNTETHKETNSADIGSVEKFVASAKRVSRRGCLDVQSIH